MAGADARVEIYDAELNRQLRVIGAREMRSWQRQTATQAKVTVPVRTGNLGRSHREGRVTHSAARDTHGSVHNDADYALYVHEGTRPHVIRPRFRQALRFQVGGSTVFARRVNHPGTRGRPWLRNAAVRVASRL